jgi:NAD(P)-dependent dehydrogenase (short-subunit alcohol dehydrogenase family)
MLDFKGAVAVVTGAGQGNGRAIALGLARAGARLALCDVNSELVDQTAAMIRSENGTAISRCVDVSDREACEVFAGTILEELGPAEILVNNAGIIRRHGIDDANFDSHWDATFRVNVDGTKNMTLALVPHLEKTAGRIVNLASIMAIAAGPGIPAYVASKGAIGQFTKALAHELAPGVIDTPMTEATRANDAAISRFMMHTPLGRTGKPEELVGPVIFLASQMSSYVTGVILPVDGGYLAG